MSKRLCPDVASSTPECRPRTKAKTSNDSAQTCKPPILNMNLSKTSAVVSTSNVGGLQPFWTASSAEWSQRLWSCTKTACVALEPNLWTPSLQSLGRGSWFTVRIQTPQRPKNLPTTSSPLPPYLWRAITANEPPKIADPESKSVVTGMRKIRLFPTREQQKVLRAWMGASRWTYNRTIEYLNDPQTQGARTIKQLRAHSVNQTALQALGRGDMNSIPYDIRDEGVRDAKKALQSNVAKLRKNKTKQKAFQLRFKCKKMLQQEEIVIHSKHWKHTRGAMFELFGTSGSKLSAAEVLPRDLGFDCRLVRTRDNRYWLCIPQCHGNWGESQVPEPSKAGVAALDPGVRTFMTVYDADGAVVDWGEGDMTRVTRLCHAVDSLQARWKTATHKRRYRMKRAAGRIRQKIRSLVDELHRKLTKWLVTHYRCILIPTFETKKMVKRGARRLSSKTARMLCTWSHFRFRTNLQHHQKRAPWLRVVETTEEYTSKTCGACGIVHEKLGGNKTFRCPRCAYEADRDANGARNILIRHLTRAGL